MWASVTERYQEWCSGNDHPVRDLESLKLKFDKFCRVKKPTGSADCPPSVRRAKKLHEQYRQSVYPPV